MARETDDAPLVELPPEPPPPGPQLDARTERRARLGVVGMLLALALFAAGYRILVRHELEQTAGLFIGLPTFLAILLVLTPRSKTLTGMLLKGVTLSLLVSAVLLQEGFVCILMAAPLFYGVAAIIGVVVDIGNGRGLFSGRRDPRVSLVFVPFLAMSLEGTTEGLSFEREESVTVTRVLALSPQAFEAALAETPQYDDISLPFYLSLGFPRPVATAGEGLAPGDRRTIHFAGGEGHPGDLVLEVRKRTPSSVHFEVLENTSHIDHWLTWHGSDVRWRPHPEGTAVTWTEHYRRDLDPSWYFAPAERYGMGLAILVNLDQLERQGLP